MTQQSSALYSKLDCPLHEPTLGAIAHKHLIVALQRSISWLSTTSGSLGSSGGALRSHASGPAYGQLKREISLGSVV